MLQERDVMSVIGRPTLLLNASYEAIRIITVKRALTLITKGRAVVRLATNVQVYPGVYAPSVIRLVEYKRIPIQMQMMSRKNLYMRDGYRCMYCGDKFQEKDLTLDHVIPKAQGGKNVWHNLVACCVKCNRMKGDKTPEEAGMPLIHRPLPITVNTSRFVLRSIGSEVKAWQPYLYHDSDGAKEYSYRA
jgi:HNH endonuclease